MKNSLLASSLALAALFSAQGAQAQEACVAPQDLTDTITYAMPIVYDSIKGKCAAQFRASTFMRNDGDAFVDQFRAKQDEAWPGTLRLLKVFMVQRSGSEDQTAAMIASLPEESLRPFVDGIVGMVITDKLGADFKPDTCHDVAEAMELIAPLPVENISGLVTFLARQADLNEPKLCTAKPSTSAR